MTEQPEGPEERAAIAESLEECVRRGWMEHAGVDAGGDQLYRLTVEGQQAVEAGFVTAQLIQGAEQEYALGGDAIIRGDGSWSCEHEDPDPPRRLTDPGTSALVTCPDCKTGWVCWTHRGRRLAKAVVERIDVDVER